MVVATFNAAGIRARLDGVLDWLAETQPDLLAIQETKVEDDKFPLGDFEELGYNVAISGQKSWNGVALLARGPITGVRRGFEDPRFPEDARIITGEVGGITFINTYVPNGSAVGTDKFDYKLRWLEQFRRFLDQNFSPSQPLVWLGDINIAPTEDDVFDPKRHRGKVGFHPDEISRLNNIVEWGLVDLFRKHTAGSGHYTFWEFTIPKSVERNLGWRIDHIYGSAPIAEACAKCWVDREARSGTRPSDHTFVLADLRLQ